MIGRDHLQNLPKENNNPSPLKRKTISRRRKKINREHNLACIFHPNCCVCNILYTDVNIDCHYGAWLVHLCKDLTDSGMHTYNMIHERMLLFMEVCEYHTVFPCSF